MEYLHVLSRPMVINHDHDITWTEAYIDSKVGPQRSKQGLLGWGGVARAPPGEALWSDLPTGGHPPVDRNFGPRLSLLRGPCLPPCPLPLTPGRKGTDQ